MRLTGPRGFGIMVIVNHGIFWVGQVIYILFIGVQNNKATIVESPCRVHFFSANIPPLASRVHAWCIIPHIVLDRNAWKIIEGHQSIFRSNISHRYSIVVKLSFLFVSDHVAAPDLSSTHCTCTRPLDYYRVNKAFVLTLRGNCLGVPSGVPSLGDV